MLRLSAFFGLFRAFRVSLPLRLDFSSNPFFIYCSSSAEISSYLSHTNEYILKYLFNSRLSIPY